MHSMDISLSTEAVQNILFSLNSWPNSVFVFIRIAVQKDIKYGAAVLLVIAPAFSLKYKLCCKLEMDTKQLTESCSRSGSLSNFPSFRDLVRLLPRV